MGNLCGASANGASSPSSKIPLLYCFPLSLSLFLIEVHKMFFLYEDVLEMTEVQILFLIFVAFSFVVC